MTIPTTATRNIILPRHPRLGFALAGVWLGALWLWLFWSCSADWREQDFQFGWLVPFLAAYFVFERLSEAAPAGIIAHTRLARAALVVLAAFILPLELLRLSPLTWRINLWMIYGLVASLSLGTAWLLYGRAGIRAILFPVLFSGLALPWPTALEVLFTQRLTESLASGCAEAMRWLGIPALAAGKTVNLGNCIVGIEDACSGMRSIQSSFILSLGLGELRRLSLPGRTGLFLAGIGLALAENFLRLLTLSWLASRGGAPLLERWHDPIGWAGLALLALGVFLLGWRTCCATPRAPHPHAPRPRTPLSPILPISLLVLSLGGLAAAHLWYAVGADGRQGPGMVLKAETANIHLVPPPSGVLAQLQATKGEYFSASLAPYGAIQGYHFYWSPARSNPRQLFHRPDICMPGAGWRMIRPPRPITLSLDGRDLAWWDFSFERAGTAVHLLWVVFVAGEVMPLQFDRDGNLYLQRTFLIESVRRRISNPSFEVAALLVPSKSEHLSPAEAQLACNRFFHLAQSSAAQP